MVSSKNVLISDGIELTPGCSAICCPQFSSKLLTNTSFGKLARHKPFDNFALYVLVYAMIIFPRSCEIDE